MAGLSQPTRVESPPEFWTRAGLAAWFEVSEHVIRKYIEWKVLPPALGKHPNGFNYDHTHFDELKKLRAELEKQRIPLRERRRQPHIVIRNPRMDAS